MTRLRRAALVSTLADALREQGSWTGETHLQKATYLLQEMLGVPLDFEYVLYKHGPYSFELHDALSEMRADDVLNVVPQPPPYGPKLAIAEGANRIFKKFPKTLHRYAPQIDYIATELGDSGVTELEKLATAFWVTAENGGNVAQRAKALNSLKPHISVGEAESAIERIDHIRSEAPTVTAA